MEVSVKAMGYVETCGTNSADVKNIAHEEQSDLSFQTVALADEKRQIEANLVETRTQRRPIS
jgi:hypothetical protein